MGSMWKPGTKKPSGRRSGNQSSPATSDGAPSSKNRFDELDRHNKKQPQQQSKVKGTDPSTTSQAFNADLNESSSPSKVVKKLSGSTLNMRFMQQRTPRQQSLSPGRCRSHEPTAAANTTTAAAASSSQQHHSRENNSFSASSPAGDEDPSNTLTNGPSSPQQYQQQQQQQHQPQQQLDNMESDESDSDVEMLDNNNNNPQSLFETATASDMYGMAHVARIGRRSFGGFNLHMAEAWSLSQPGARTSSNSAAAVSDQELLKRYQENRQKTSRTQNKRPRSEEKPRKAGKKTRLSG